MSSELPITLDGLRKNLKAIELLSEYFDLGIFSSNEDCDWFVIEPAQDFTVFAREGAGGRFLLLETTGWVIYVSSEGKAGVLGYSLLDFLHLVVVHPYWEDLLKFSGKGILDEMRKALPMLEESLVGEEPEIDSARNSLMAAFHITSNADPVEALHHAVSSSRSQIIVRATMDDSVYESLFNHFTVKDNPFWRNAQPCAAQPRSFQSLEAAQ